MKVGTMAPKVRLAKWFGLTRQAALTPSHSFGKCDICLVLRPCVFGAYDHPSYVPSCSSYLSLFFFFVKGGSLSGESRPIHTHTHKTKGKEKGKKKDRMREELKPKYHQLFLSLSLYRGLQFQTGGVTFLWVTRNSIPPLNKILKNGP